MLNKLFPLLATATSEHSTQNIQNLHENTENHEDEQSSARIQVTNAEGNSNIFSSQNYMYNPINGRDSSNIFASAGISQDSGSDEFVRTTQEAPTQDVQISRGLSYSKPGEHIENRYVSKDGEIKATKQPEDKGNCWLHSAVNSHKWTDEGRKILDELIDVKDGYTTFHFGAKGSKTDINVSDKEVAYAREKLKDKYSKGDDDMIALEIGVEKYLQNAQYNENTPSYVKDLVKGSDKSTIDSGNFEKALYILAGKSGTIFKPNSIIKDGQCQKGINGIDAALNIYKSNSSNSQLMNASIGKGNAALITNLSDNQEITLKDEHQYAVKNITDDTVTIVDPWNSEEEIKISIADFKRTFTQIEYADLNNTTDDRNYNV